MPSRGSAVDGRVRFRDRLLVRTEETVCHYKVDDIVLSYVRAHLPPPTIAAHSRLQFVHFPLRRVSRNRINLCLSISLSLTPA